MLIPSGLIHPKLLPPKGGGQAAVLRARARPAHAICSNSPRDQRGSNRRRAVGEDQILDPGDVMLCIANELPQERRCADCRSGNIQRHRRQLQLLSCLILGPLSRARLLTLAYLSGWAIGLLLALVVPANLARCAAEQLSSHKWCEVWLRQKSHLKISGQILQT